MKTILVSQPGQLSVAEKELPAITAPDQVLMKVKRVGLCGSDNHIYHGSNPFVVYPRVIGHEFAGTVEAVGEAVTNVKVGDHVVGEPIEFCGECYACRQGRGNVCQNLTVYGVHKDGGAQEYIVMPAAHVYKVEDSIPWNTAVLAEPLTIGFQACWRGGVQPGDFVLVMGGGTIGLCCLLAAKKKGAMVAITDILDDKLEYAKKLGADYAINVKQTALADAMAELTGGMGPNVVLDAVCSKTSLEEAIELASVAGRVVGLGLASGVVSELSHVTMAKKEVGVFGSRLQNGKFPEAIALIESDPDLLADFVTQEYALDQAQEAFDFFNNCASQVRKILIQMD